MITIRKPPGMITHARVTLRVRDKHTGEFIPVKAIDDSDNFDLDVSATEEGKILRRKVFVAFAHEMEPRNKAPLIALPPGNLVLDIAEFLCSQGVYERVFLQAILDIREEYFEALSAHRSRKARWVLIRGYLNLAWTVVLQVGTGLISKIVKAAAGSGG